MESGLWNAKLLQMQNRIQQNKREHIMVTLRQEELFSAVGHEKMYEILDIEMKCSFPFS